MRLRDKVKTGHLVAGAPSQRWIWKTDFEEAVFSYWDAVNHAFEERNQELWQEFVNSDPLITKHLDNNGVDHLAAMWWRDFLFRTIIGEQK